MLEDQLSNAGDADPEIPGTTAASMRHRDSSSSSDYDEDFLDGSGGPGGGGRAGAGPGWGASQEGGWGRPGRLRYSEMGEGASIERLLEGSGPPSAR